MPPVITPPDSTTASTSQEIAVDPTPCPECDRIDCADEVEAYLHEAARGTS